MERKIKRIVAAAAVAAALGVSQARADFNSGNLVVLRLGDGSATVTDAAQALYLDEYNITTGALVASHALPSSGAGAITLSGAGDHDGHLNFSADGQYLLLGGYRADAGTGNPVPQSAATVNRVIGRVDSNWNADTSTALTDAFDQGSINAVLSDNGQRFWVAGDGTSQVLIDPSHPEYGYTEVDTTTGGLRYVAAPGNSLTVNLSQTQSLSAPSGLEPDSLRSATLVDGQLYILTASQGSFVNRGLFATADPLPTTGPQTMIPVMNNIEGNSSDPGQELGPDPKGKFVPKSDVVLLDLNPAIAGVDTAYSTGGKQEYEKWSLATDGFWHQTDVEVFAGAQDINALSAMVNGGVVELLAATDSGIYKLTDANGWDTTIGGAFSSTPFISAGGDTLFRGIAVEPSYSLAAVPEPTAALGMLAMAMGAAAGRRRRR